MFALLQIERKIKYKGAEEAEKEPLPLFGLQATFGALEHSRGCKSIFFFDWVLA